MSARSDRKAAKRRELERLQRLEHKRAQLAEELSFVHTDGSSFDQDQRVGAVLLGPDGQVHTRRVESPAAWASPTRSVDPHQSLPSGHPRSSESASASKALIRDAARPGNWGGAPSGIDPVLLGE